MMGESASLPLPAAGLSVALSQAAKPTPADATESGADAGLAFDALMLSGNTPPATTTDSGVPSALGKPKFGKAAPLQPALDASTSAPLLASMAQMPAATVTPVIPAPASAATGTLAATTVTSAQPAPGAAGTTAVAAPVSALPVQSPLSTLAAPTPMAAATENPSPTMAATNTLANPPTTQGGAPALPVASVQASVSTPVLASAPVPSPTPAAAPALPSQPPAPLRTNVTTINSDAPTPSTPVTIALPTAVAQPAAQASANSDLRNVLAQMEELHTRALPTGPRGNAPLPESPWLRPDVGVNGDSPIPVGQHPLPPILRLASPGIVPPSMPDAMHPHPAAADNVPTDTDALPTSVLAAIRNTATLPPGAAALSWPPSVWAQPTAPAVAVPAAVLQPLNSAVATAATDAANAASNPAFTMAGQGLPASATQPSAAVAATMAAVMQALEPATGSMRASQSAPDPGIGPASAPVAHLATLLPTAPSTTLPASIAPAPLLQQPANPAAGYDDKFGNHLAWMAGQRITHAQIRVSPEHMGTIDIRVQVDGNDVRAEFHSAHADVRQTLEASLPRLREMLNQHGLQLAHAGVGQGQAQAQGRKSFTGETVNGTSVDAAAEDASPATGLPESRRHQGVLDVYA